MTTKRTERIEQVEEAPRVSGLSSVVERLFSADPIEQAMAPRGSVGFGDIANPRPSLVYHVCDFTKYTPAEADNHRATLAQQGWRPISGPYHQGAEREDALVVGIPHAEVYQMPVELARKLERERVEGWLKNKRFRAMQRARRDTRGMLPRV